MYHIGAFMNKLCDNLVDCKLPPVKYNNISIQFENLASLQCLIFFFKSPK